MITYSTQFPVNGKLDRKTFVELVLDWNQGSKYDKFSNLDWDGEDYSLEWDEDGKLLIIDEIVQKNIVVSRFQKEDEHGVWKTDFVLNEEEKHITIKVTLETTEFTTDFYPSYHPPFFVKKLIYREYAGIDAGLQVSQKAFSMDEQIEVVHKLRDGRFEHNLPIVIVSKKDNGEFPVDLSKLAFQLQGVAHVIFEDENNSLLEYANYFGCQARNGMVFIVYPNKNIKIKVVNLLGSNNENPEYIVTRITTAVYNYSNQVMRAELDTWEGIQNEKLHIQNYSLLSDQKALEEENEDLLNVFGEQLSKTEKINKELTNDIQKLMIENQALRMRLSSKDQQPLLYMGEESEFYEGEIREILLEILDEYCRNVMPSTRRAHVIADILENNPYKQIQAKRREQIKVALKGYKTLNGSLRNVLEGLGFEISDDGKHYKWTYFGDHRYVTTVAKTCSDNRAGMNIASTIDNLML